MASMDITEKSAVYNDEKNQPHVLLDFTKHLANKSRISMHKGPGWDISTLPEILAGLYEKEKQNGESLCLPTLLLDTLLAARLIQTSQPVRVLEYGCKDGRLSWHLAELLGRFHPESSLVCAYHAMDEDWVKWMEQVYQVQQAPKISYISGEYGHLQLQKDHFDIVLINGMVNFTDPEQVIRDVLSLAAEDGIILCYEENAPLLEDTFKLYFEECDEYKLGPFEKVLAAKASDQSWEPMPGITVQVQEDLKEAKHIRTEDKRNRENLKDLIDRLHRDAQWAAKLGIIDLKLRLIEEKEKMVEFAYLCDTSMKQQEAKIQGNEKEHGDHMEVSWQKNTMEAVKNGRKVIFQRFPSNAGGRHFPYPPIYREPDTDYICFTDDTRVYSSTWKIQIVENVAQADLEPWLGQYAVRWELQPEQIQMGSLAEDYAGENVVAIPKLKELPLVKFDPEKLVPTADEDGRYIYRRNPVYSDGKYNGRPLLLTIGVPVSNQIDTIDRCLSQVKPLLEQLDAELLVIDTGSTDGTVEVCRSYGARVITYPWCDNMSAARNEGIYNARGEWYLSIDDDEWFEDVGDILDFFSQGSYQDYDQATYIQRNYRDSDGVVYDDYNTLRMARITPGLHFEGRIHDALLVEPGLDRLCALNSYAHHYGFVGDNPEKKQEKFLRNATSLLQDIYEYPENLRYLFQMAQEYASIHQNETAIKLLLKTIAMAKEMESEFLGKNSVVVLASSLYALKDPRLFGWVKCINSLFPLTAAEQAYIAWCQETLAFLTGRAPEQVLEYYGIYENALEEYRKAPVLNQRSTYFGLMAVEQEPCIMDAQAMAFCSYLGAGREENALEIFSHISLEKIPEQRISVLAWGFAAGDKVYEAVCSKIAPMQWEEGKEEILNAFVAGLSRDSGYKQQMERLPDLLSRISVPNLRSWFENAGERRTGKVGERLLWYALECEVEKNSVQALCLCTEVLKEAYVQNRKSEKSKEIFCRYLSILAAFAERYYNSDLLIDAECRAIPPDICAAYRMAVVLADGKSSHENVVLLKQALAVFPSFHEEIHGILAELKG